LKVTDFEEPFFEEEMINNLVMDPDRVESLKAWANSYARTNKLGLKSNYPAWTADSVQGKGNGLIFLLHGKPGVGKTCTAGTSSISSNCSSPKRLMKF
jgi:Cdc6-like AAA superfamily ATPase